VSDAPGWAAAGIAATALTISSWSAALSWKAFRWERLSAEAAGRSAEAAERANLLPERTLTARSATQVAPSWTHRIGEGGLTATGTGETAESTAHFADVSWLIENPEKNRFILRNTGTDVAEHVEVDQEQIDAPARNLPQDAVIRPGEGVDMLLLATWGCPLPNQLYVRWDGHPDWEAVPLVIAH